MFAAANTAGVGFGEVAELGVDEVRRLLLPDPSASVSDRAAPDFEYVHHELGRPSVTLLLLWNEYVARCRQTGEVPYQYSFFNEQYRRWAKATGASMRIPRNPGESVEVDWAGDPMAYADPITGQPVNGVAVRGCVLIQRVLVRGDVRRYDTRVLDHRARVRKLRRGRAALDPRQPPHRGIEGRPIRAGAQSRDWRSTTAPRSSQPESRQETSPSPKAASGSSPGR
ncbi:hypothetical protein [Agromyces laixinhei]|uniref:hypothetical protein n=1 Tax=Agromyces laixinhei TaxID=2585717 RepID=UPI0011174CFC|nr:hypothetical protein [Agromyces laixinhei]